MNRSFDTTMARDSIKNAVIIYLTEKWQSGRMYRTRNVTDTLLNLVKNTNKII
jgi:hypothetical protein